MGSSRGPRSAHTRRASVRPSPNNMLDYREFPLLYVDDEAENLRVFELTFRREFKVLTAISAFRGHYCPLRALSVEY